MKGSLIPAMFGELSPQMAESVLLIFTAINSFRMACRAAIREQLPSIAVCLVYCQTFRFKYITV